jgi:pullulanase/glycogen debranching enzyme
VGSLKLSRVKEGSAAAHGAIWDGKGTNFTLFSANATNVEICLFDSHGAKPETRFNRLLCALIASRRRSDSSASRLWRIRKQPSEALSLRIG